MAKPKTRGAAVSDYKDKLVNPKDLSDEKKAKILNEEFMAFQAEMKDKLGLQIGVRLQEIKNETTIGYQAILVPVKLPPAKESAVTQDKTNEQEKSA